MKSKILFPTLLVLLAILFVALLSNSKKEEDHHFDNPAYVVESETGGIPTVVLTEKAVKRLNIQIVTTNKNQLVIPYSTIRYDKYGDTWVYTNPEPFTYIREQVYINSVGDDKVFLRESLPENINVVTVGVPELSGVEHGIGQGGGGH